MEAQQDYHVPIEVDDSDLAERRASSKRYLHKGLITLVLAILLNEIKPLWLAPPARGATWLFYLIPILVGLYLTGRGLARILLPRRQLLVMLLWLTLTPLCLCVAGFSQKARYEFFAGGIFFTSSECDRSGQHMSCAQCNYNPDFNEETVIRYRYRLLGPTGLMWLSDSSIERHQGSLSTCLP